MLRSLFGSDWKKSPAHLLFLSKFRTPRSPDYCADSETWQSVLEQSPRRAINRYVNDGMLEEPPLADRIAHKYKVTDLKQMLRDRSLRVSGRKAELIDRLLRADRNSMERAVRGLELLRLTEDGETVVQGYLADQRDRRERAEHRALVALRNEDFKTASNVVAAFEAKQVFSRGIGMDWKHHDPRRDVSLLKTISYRTPRILAALDDKQIDQLRIAAAMMYLWGTNRAKAWLPEDLETDLHMDDDSAARMLVFHAHHRQDVKQYKELGVKTVGVRAAHDACVFDILKGDHPAEF
jgi:hypothetical protein